ncbi:hypothetical protein [Aeromicrobium sp. UC242_57]|uniref:hypothetical protein n=1 Tax=Aeromicrobium sp. UC242_57 TaxID=3374624 RepID=UPI0037B3E602
MLAASMLVLWIAVKLGAGVAAAQVPSDVASTDAVHAYYRQLTSLLRDGTVTVGIIALIAAGLAFGWDLVTRRRPAA